MRSRNALRAVVVCLLVCSVCPLLYSQANGSFSGTVSDKTGSVISGATVKVISQGTGASREAKTDDSGHYLIPLLPVAIYTLRVESQGFQTAEQKDVRLQLDEHRELDFTLSPASVSEKVEVSATEVAVETTNPTLGQVITEQQVAELPLNGRNFVQLATLTPGTTQETNPNSFFNGAASSEVSARGSYSLSVGGSRASSTEWLFDGNDNNELTAGGIAILPSIDAIQEFKVLTFNYSAQYGTRAGPTVLVTTKSGSNQLHGTLFEFFRNTKLDARSFFASEREKFNLNQFGGSLGGPIQKEKTFFFVDYQAKMQRHGIPFTGFVPTTAMAAGDFTHDTFGNPVSGQFLFNPYSSTPGNRTAFMCDNAGNALPVNPDGTQASGTPCNIIPRALINPISAQMVKFYPSPTPGITSGGFNFVNQPVRKLNEGEFDIRLDHHFSSNDSAFARFSYDQATSFVPGGSDFAEQNSFGSTETITNHGRNAALSETHIFSANTINQINAGYNRIFNHILSFANGTCVSANIGIPGANINSKCANAPPGATQSIKDCVSCGLTSTQVGGGFWSLGDRGFAPFQGGTNVFTISDSFDMIRGKHDIRIGGEFRANQLNVLANGFQDGFWVYTNLWSANASGGGGSTMADFLLGYPDVAIHDQTFQGATTGRRWKVFRPYVQDDWRVTKDLTLNLGLAWALVTPTTENRDRQSNFDLATGTYLIPHVNSDSRVGVQMDKKAFEPRIGLAWKAFGSQKTAVRAGYAIFHDSSWNMGGQGLWQDPPFYGESDFFGFVAGGCPSQTAPSGATSFCANNGMAVTGQSMSAGFPILTPTTAFTGAANSQNRNFKLGRVQQFNLNIERQLPADLVLTVGYAGARSSHILSSFLNLNVASPPACGVVPGYTLGCGAPTPPVPSNPFLAVFGINDVGRAHYDGLQVKAETKSARHGLYALVGYTWARNLDTGLTDGLGSSTGATYYPLPNFKKLDWGLSQIQLNQNFTASVIYDLPFGKGKRFGGDWGGVANASLGNWSVNVIEKATSGFPLFMVAGFNQSGVNFSENGTALNRPNQVGDPFKPGPVAANPGCVAPNRVRTIQNWFNPCAFMDAPAGQLGNASRTPIFGPDFVNTDLSLIKRFPLPREGMGLDFRAEFFNLFNHAQFYLPGNPGAGNQQDVDSPTTFGSISGTAHDPRVIQFALKLTF